MDKFSDIKEESLSSQKLRHRLSPHLEGLLLLQDQDPSLRFQQSMVCLQVLRQGDGKCKANVHFRVSSKRAFVT